MTRSCIEDKNVIDKSFNLYTKKFPSGIISNIELDKDINSLKNEFNCIGRMTLD